MTAVPKAMLTPAEYLTIERQAEHKSEYYRGEMFAMAGASYEHTRATDNLIGELHARLKGGQCFVLSRDMRVKVSATGLYTYPDAVIVCGKPEFEDERADNLLNPQVVIEVLSNSTESYDRGKKFEQYQHLASVREYVLVAQDRMRIERFVRQADDTWLLTVFADSAGEFAMSTVPVRIPLADIYAGIAIAKP